MTKTVHKVFILLIPAVLLLSGCENGGADTTSDNQDNSNTPVDHNATLSTASSVIYDSDSDIKPVVNPYQTAGWYGRTTVSATAPDGTVYRHNTAGIFGELLQSSDDQDQHDVKGYGPAILQVIFVPDFTTDTDAGYFSDYRKYDQSNTKHSWTFQVKNQNTVDLSNAPITISLPAIYDVRYKETNGTITYQESSESNTTLLNQLTLVDVDNNMKYSVSELQTASLNMDGKHTRTFRWVLGAVDQDDYIPLPAPQRAAGRNPTPEFQAAPANTGGKFGLPPQ